jgi:hypothetical protein
MAIDRMLWKGRFGRSNFPAWICPRCQIGVLALDEGSLTTTETADSIESRNLYDWQPEWFVQRFVCSLICLQRSCKETVFVLGRTKTEEWYDSEGEPADLEFLIPIFLYPAPDIFRIPTKCPNNIKEEIRRAFSLYWCDTGASANRIRSSIEMLLTHQKIKQAERTKKGKLQQLNLHRRIELYKTKQPDRGNELMAIKWLGNSGSHPSGLDKDDLLDAFEILDHVLDEIFVNRTKRISEMARQINRRKGPRLKVNVGRRLRA